MTWTEVMEGLEIDAVSGNLRTVGPTRDLLRAAALEILRLRNRVGFLRIGDHVRILASGKARICERYAGKEGEVIALDTDDKTLPYRVLLDREFEGERRWWFGSNDLELIPPTESVSIGTRVRFVREPEGFIFRRFTGKVGFIKVYDGSDRMPYRVEVTGIGNPWCWRKDFEPVKEEKTCSACGGAGSFDIEGEAHPEPCLVCNENGTMKE